MYIDNPWFLCLALLTMGVILGYGFFRLREWLSLGQQDPFERANQQAFVRLHESSAYTASQNTSTDVVVLQGRIKQLEADLARYQAQVASHYAQTTMLVDDVSDHYKRMVEHLQDSADVLIPPETRQDEQNRVAFSAEAVPAPIASSVPRGYVMATRRPNSGLKVRMPRLPEGSGAKARQGVQKAGGALGSGISKGARSVAATWNSAVHEIRQKTQSRKSNPELEADSEVAPPMFVPRNDRHQGNEGSVASELSAFEDAPISQSYQNIPNAPPAEATEPKPTAQPTETETRAAFRSPVSVGYRPQDLSSHKEPTLERSSGSGEGEASKMLSGDTDERREVLYPKGHDLKTSGQAMRNMNIGLPKTHTP